MNNSSEIMDIALPIEVAADMTSKAASHGVPTHEYLGIVAIAGAYGHLHPKVIEFKRRAKAGINGPETQGAEK